MMSDPPVHFVIEEAYNRLFTGPWRSYSLSGVFLAPIGLALTVLPVFSENKVLALSGVLLAAAGTIMFVSAVSGRRLPGFIPSLALGLVSLLAGICLTRGILFSPGSLTPLFAAYFILAGSLTILLAESHRHQLLANREWLTMSGFLSLNLGLVSLSRLPEAFIWTFSVFLGLHFLIHGSALIAVALTPKVCRGNAEADVCKDSASSFPSLRQ